MFACVDTIHQSHMGEEMQNSCQVKKIDATVDSVCDVVITGLLQ